MNNKFFLIAIFSLFLTGCGLSGPLYLLPTPSTPAAAS